MSNERSTENLVRDILREKKYYDNNKIVIEEQSSSSPNIQKLLMNASKRGNGIGKPEFIISFLEEKELLIVIECKADIKKHESKDRDKFADFAVDGALLYASYLSKEYNVFAVAVSGTKREEMKVSNFFIPKGNKQPKELADKSILNVIDYTRISRLDESVIKVKISDLIKFSKELHDDMREYAKLTEQEKPLLVSAVLLALTDKAFKSSYHSESNAQDLADSVTTTIRKVLKNAKLDENKIRNMSQSYSFIEVHPELTKGTVLYDLIKKLEKHVKPFLDEYQDIDVVGQFYGEFLRYSGGDKKGLGVVLTPKHITDLFAKMARLTVNSVVLDTCCGTGAFLISAMSNMLEKAGNDEEAKKKIKKNNLIGVEHLAHMYALGCSNMILRGDGKSNLYFGSCFDLTSELKKRRPTVGLINPPYSQEGEGLSELHFVNHLLNCLEPNSIGIAIVPLSCAIGTEQQKATLLENHTLEAVMSMPEDLFHKAGTVTCIMVFRAKIPHDPNYETWFGYWRNDGFVKTKNDGRIDKDQKWKETESLWLDMYFNKKEIPGYSLKRKVQPNDEWCIEAYIETDYSNLSEEDFEQEMAKFAAFQLLEGGVSDTSL